MAAATSTKGTVATRPAVNPSPRPLTAADRVHALEREVQETADAFLASDAERLRRRHEQKQAELEHARADVIADAQADRQRRIEHVAGTVLAKAQADLTALIDEARRTRTMDAVHRCDLKARQVSGLWSRLLEVTRDERRFHPSRAPDLRRLFGPDAELVTVWKRSRNPFESRPAAEPLPGAEALDGLGTLSS